MPTTTASGSSVLEELRSRHSDLQTEIQGLIEERDRLHTEFQSLSSRDDRPSEDEVTRFEARRNHEDASVRPSDSEIRSFEARQNAGPSDEDVRQFNQAHGTRRAEIRSKMDRLTELTDQIDEKGQLERSRGRAERASQGLEFSHIERQVDPLTYREDNQYRYSYFLDLAAMSSPEVRSRDHRLEGYQERLQSHSKEMADQLPSRWSSRKAAAEQRVDDAENAFRNRVGASRGGFDISPFERRNPEITREQREVAEMEQRAPSRIVGQGGYGVPPLWLEISPLAA